MHDSRVPEFAAELCIPTTTVIITLFALGGVLTLIALLLSLPTATLFFALLLYGLAALLWGISQFRPRFGSWLMVTALTTLIILADRWLAVPGVLALSAIPIAVTAASISSRGATIAAVGESVLLIVLSRSAGGGVDFGLVGAPLVSIWATLGIFCAVHEREVFLSNWSWQQFQRAQKLLDEARDQRADLQQTLQELAAANLQLTRLNHLAQGLRQMAEEARRTKEEFVARVSHELRTPLNMIIGFSEMIMENPGSYGHVPPALLADLAIILRNSQHLSSLINDVLELSQVEAGQVALSRERVSLGEIIEAASVAVRPLYESKGLYLKADEASDVWLCCDRTRIREVLLNLLINAGRYTEHGGVCIQVREGADDVVVSVADTGPGIAPEDQRQLFQPFHQVDGSIRRRYGGTGLGLNISKSFVELHGGTIWVKSEKEQGAVFSFRLPKEAPLPIKSDAIRWLTPGWEHVQRTEHLPLPVPHLKRRLVILERGHSLQTLLNRHMDDIEVVPVTSLEEAGSELARAPAQALLMNEPSVISALERLSDTSILPEGTPAIICSLPGAYEMADTIGAHDYLVKPISRDALLEAIDRVCPTGRTVLIVDDEPDAQRLFRRMLISSGRGYRVLRSSDGQHALNILREQHPDVALIDLVMPGMDGLTLLAAKNADPALRRIPAIVTTARDPHGQPIVTSAIAVTRRGGLSIQQLLRSIDALSDIASTAGQVADRGRLATPAGLPAC